MADIKLAMPKKVSSQSGDESTSRSRSQSRSQSPSVKAPKEMVQPDPEMSRSLLSRAGGTALSGLHTVGSILSTPSRVLWGSINGMAGGDGGFGNMNPLDSTGGIELSHVLGNAGAIPKNDPNKWEWGDLGRGVVDIAGDPTTLLGVGGLTRAGQLAKQSGTAVRGAANSIRAGERGLLSLHNPLTGRSLGAVGTGLDVGDAVARVGERTGLRRGMELAAESAPVRIAKSMMSAPMKGKLHASIQRYMPHSHELSTAAQRRIDIDSLALETRIRNAGLHTADHNEIFRDLLEEIPNAGATADHHRFVNEMWDLNDRSHALDRTYGISTGDLVGDNVRQFPRRQSVGIPGNGYGHADASNRVHEREAIYKNIGGAGSANRGTNSINRILQNPAADAAIVLSEHLPVADRVAAASAELARQFPDIDPEQINHFATTMVESPNVRHQGLFGNSVLHDLNTRLSGGNRRHRNADVIFNAVNDELHAGPHGVNVRRFLQDADLVPEVAAAHIAGLRHEAPGFDHIDNVLNSYIPDDLATELRTLTPGYRTPPAHTAISDAARSLQTIWKASMLAMPASRTRDAASGVVQNTALGHGGFPGSTGWNEARNIAHAAPLTTDYSHLPDVQRLMDPAGHGLTHDEAVKVLLAVEAPRNSGAVADIAPGTVGASLDDMHHMIPGNERSGVREVMARAGRSLVRGELGRNGLPISQGSRINPANVGGALEGIVSGAPRETTAFGPAAASNVLSGASDEFNRHAGILGQMSQGYYPHVAGQRTRAAQVDYNPNSFSDFEKNYLKQLAPFYGFTSRMMGHTANELATHPGGTTGQLLKAEDRAHASDPAIPDHILGGTALPLGTKADGTRNFLTGAGFMHEPAVNTLGSVLGGNLRGAGYDALGMLNPLGRVPLEQITGQSFFQRGEPQQNLDPNIGRTMSNVMVGAGMRDADAGPVKYPGSSLVEAGLGLSPFSRLASSARTATDTRKNVIEKMANLLTGVRTTDVSPKSQAYTLMRRAEILAKESGAKSRQDVFFSKKELERLDQTDPKLAEKQRQLQKLLNSLKSKSTKKGGKDKNSGNIRLEKKEKMK